MGWEEDFELVKQGAEGRIFKGTYLGRPVIVKERFKKKYRHATLDEHITKERIKAEARSIVRCKVAGVCTPALYLVDFERRCIYMEEIVNSRTVKDYLRDICEKPESKEDLAFLTEEIGKAIGKMHSSNMIHGDLTTSNILVVNEEDLTNRHLVFIDFGLSYAQGSSEEKGVDLYVLERALISTHANAEHLFSAILASYKKHNKKNPTDVMKKLDDIRARGRKRTMVG